MAQNPERKWRLWWWAVVLAVVVGCALLRHAFKTPRSGSKTVTPSYQLTSRFTGLTNNPVWVPSRLAVAGNGKGLYALFAVTNNSPNQFIRFKTLAIERRNGTNWQEFEPSGEWRGMEGFVWQPGFGLNYAVAWPPGLPTNTAWRLKLEVSQEPSQTLRIANEKLGRELFSPTKPAIILTPEIEPAGGIPQPLKLLSQ